MMRYLLAASVVVFAVVSAGCGGAPTTDPVTDGGGTVKGDGGTIATPTDAGAVIMLTGSPIVATAPMGTGELVLGTPVDQNFNQVNGSVVFQPNTTHVAANAFRFEWVQAQSSKELAANIKGWGLGSAALDASNSTRYMSMRANQVDYFEEVDLTKGMSAAPSSAVYFVSKLYFGHSFEALFQADQTVLTADVAAKLKVASGSISAKVSEYNLQESNVGRGMSPKSGSAIFASNTADVMANYSADANAAVPIFIEYRLIPGATEAAGTTIDWVSSIKPTIHIDEIDIFHNGAHFDASNTAWTISVGCKLNGSVVSTSDPLWTQNSVTAGGSNVVSGSGPQDPNTQNPSSTYGKYSGLTFSKPLSALAGDTIECALSGLRTDPSTPVMLPPVSFTVTVNSTPTSGYVGNSDTGNNLDYLIHYSVSY